MVHRLLGKKVIGIKQSAKALNNGDGKVLYVAADAQSDLIKPVIDLAEGLKIEVRFVDTMKELGRLCGIDVGAAVTLLLK
jgi:large subunit ribosomal protein L7A